MTITIHGTAKSRALRNLWLAQELGIAYQHDDVDFRDGGTNDPAFRALNPMGQVPALSDGDFVMTESWAINLYLAKKAGGPLAPKDVQEDALCEMWTLFAATQIEKPALDAFIQRFVKPAAETDHAVVTASLKQAERPLRMLDDALVKGGGWLVGGRCTVADINVGGAIFYFRRSLEDIAPFTHVSAWWAKLSAMPGYRHAMALRGE